MERLGYYNGKYGPIEEMTIPMDDRVCWFGDGVYDAGPCRNYHIFALDEHIDRFFRNAAELRIEIPVGKKELSDLLNKLVREMDCGDLFVYFQVTRGTGPRKHAFTEGCGNLWITLTPFNNPDGTVPMHLITAEDTRYLHCNIKTLNLIPSVMAAQKAEEAGCSEAVFYRPGNIVTECAHSNVHIIRNGVLRTHPADHLILSGIARAHLLRACEALRIPYEEEAFTLEELFDADEVLVTSSSKLVMHAELIDGKPVGMKAPQIYNRLREYLIEEYEGATGG